MSARVSELLVFSFLLPVAIWGVFAAIRRDRTWIAGALAGVGACVFSIVVTLRGDTLMGGGHYGIDPRRPREATTTGEVVLAVVAALVPVAAWLVVKVLRRR